MRRWTLWLILFFSLVGLAGSFLATQQYFQILQFGFETKSFCAINEYINCDAAYASSHAQLFGIPVSGLGFLYYLLNFAFALWILWQNRLAPRRSPTDIASFGWILSLGGLGMTLQKAYVAFFVLKVLCLICLAMYVVNTALLIGWHLFLNIGLNFRAIAWKKSLKSLLPITIAVFGLGALGLNGYQEKLLKGKKLGVKPQEVVAFHFRQSEYQFEIDSNRPVWGNPQAKVTVVDFSDFQCPYCKHAAFHIKPVLTEFKNKLRLFYYHYPIDAACNENIKFPAHDKACLAAQASVCAQNQGDFWGYHDDLFRNQERLGLELMLALAKQRGWDEKDFQACIESEAAIAQVKKDIEAATRIHLGGTPTILINNRLVRYWADPAILRAILKAEIHKIKN